MRNLLSYGLRKMGLFFGNPRIATGVLIALPVLSGALLMKGDRPDYLPDTWVSAAGSMVAARSGGCAVLLPGGRVLFAGGENAGGALSSAEMLAQGGRFRSAAPMLSAHSSAACALLADGTVMVAGGRVGGGFSNATDIYHPLTNQWTAGPTMLEARAGAAVAVLNDGRVLISGGDTAAGPSDWLELYDPESGTFRAVSARLSAPRTRHAAAVLPDGRVLIAGGWDGSHALDTAELFDPVTGRIADAGKMAAPRAGLSATTLLDGRVLVAGGTSGQGELGAAEVFDPQTGQWTADGSLMLTPRQDHAAILVPDNNTVLFVGGTAAGLHGAAPVPQTEIYVPWHHEFRALASLPGAATGVMAVALAQPGNIAVAGGRGPAGPLGAAATISLPAIQTDRPNYHPGDTVQFRGSGWAPGQDIGISFPENSNAEAASSLVATADALGNWTAAWVAPDTAGLGITIYPTATQKYADGRGSRRVLTARTAATNTAAALKISSNCKGNGSGAFSFGTSLCAGVSGLSAQTASEQFAWVAPSGTIYAFNATVSGGQATNTQMPNKNGTWTVKVYPAGSCGTSAWLMGCSGTPDAEGTVSISGGKLAFTTPSATFSSGGCSPAITVQTQTSGGAAVASTFSSDLTLATSSSLGSFAAAPDCSTAATGATIAAGTSSTTFYYSDKAPSATVIASTASLTAGTQTVKTTLNPPALSMAFGGPTIPLNAATNLTFTVANPTTNSATLSGIGFIDNLPVQIAVAAPSGLVGSCGGGTITAAAGSSSVNLAGASLAPGASCTFSVNIRGQNVGPAYNSAIPSAANGGSGTAATANATVVAPPSIAESFGAQSLALNASTSLTFTITNPVSNTVPVAGVAFTNSLPAGLVVAAPNGLSGNCGGTVTAVSGSAGIALSGGSLPVNASCVIAVNVTATASGSKTNTVSVDSTTGGPGNTASGTISVAMGPSVAAAFGAAAVPLKGSTALTFTITNPNPASGLSGVSLSDPLPAGLAVATPSGATGNCGAGTLSAPAGGAAIALTGGTVAAGASCTFAVNITGTAAGPKTNTTGAVTSIEAGAGNAASAALNVIAPPSITLAFGTGNIAVAASTSLSFVIANPAANSVALSGVAFADSLPAGLAVSSTPALTGACGGTVSATPGAAAIALSNGAVPQNGSCTISVNVTASAAGSLADTVQVSSTNGGVGNTASAALQVQSTAIHLAVSAPASATAGAPFNYTVSALDAANNPVTTYSGSVQFTSSDPQALLPAASRLTNGSGTFAATLKTAGKVTVTAADTTTASITGVTAIAVSAAVPSAIFATGGTPQSATVNTAFAAPLQATVRDSFGNNVSGVTVTFATPAAGAAAILSNGTATTNSAGIAEVTASANVTSGGYTVSVKIASATAAFLLTNVAAAGIGSAPPSSSLGLNGTVAGTYSVPNASPYNSVGSFYIDLRVSNWGRLSGACATIAQFVTSPQYGPSRIQLCDPAYGWGAISVGEYIDGTSGGAPVWMQAPNIAITAATATNPMKITLASAPFPAAMAVGRTITIVNAAGAGCSGMNANQVITAVSGNTLILKYDGTGCAYTASSGMALSQDFVFRYHRDLAAKQLIGEVWNVDGTGHTSKSLNILSSASIALPATLQIGSSGLTANVAFLRWYSGTILVGAPPPSGASGGNLADWEFDGSGNDSSGHNLNISFAAAPAYVPSPSYPPACSAGVSQSFRAGQPATLDGTGSYPLDGGSTLTYSWTQIPSLLSGVPTQNLTWSSATAVQPTIAGFGFGPMDFQLTVTQGDGQSSTCTVHDGAVLTDSNGVVLTATGSSSLDNALATIVGPQVQLGQNPWAFYDQVAIADAAIQIADMDQDYLDYWDTSNTGTVSVTAGSHTITGSGTTFTTTFCQGPGSPTVPRSGASIIVWYLTGRTVNGAPETGRRRMMVNSCSSDTQLVASLPSNGTGWATDAPDGSGLSYTADFYAHLWEYGGAPANYYDNVQAYYSLYYRSGIDTYLDAARKLADRFWTSPEIDRGMAFNVGDWFGAQSGRANSISGLVLRALDTFDGHPDMWDGLHNVWSYTDWLLSYAYPNWSSQGGIDAREYGYTLAQAAYGALWDPDPTWQAYCRSMIQSSFQTDSSGIWPKNLDSVQQGWLQWFQMKSTFDSNQPWSGSTVTLTNGSNMVACAGGNCGWQASDFAAYDLNSGSTCTGGATCGTLPVLFTDSAAFPADSSHTDPVSYCYPSGCTFVDSNHFTLDRPYGGPSGTHGWVFGVSNGSVGATAAGVVGWGGLPYMEGILGWSFDLAGTAMACDANGQPSNCDSATSSLAYSYSAMAANWITNYGLMPQYYGAAYFGGFPVCGAFPDPGNLWCNKGDTPLQSRELLGDAYRGLAAAYRRAPSQSLKAILDNWYAGMWAKPGMNAVVSSPDGQYDVTFDPTGCSGCGFFLTDGAPYSQKFFGQHFGISNEGGWGAVRQGY